MNKLKELMEMESSGPLVEAEVWTYSASQLALFDGCKRKWFFQYVLGYRPPPTASQEVGNKIHGEIEDYYKNGTECEDLRARAGLQHLPPPSNKVMAEGSIFFPILDGKANFRGYIDLIDASNPNEPEIIDHKTTSDLKWAKVEYELRNNIQMMSYAHWALNESNIFNDAQQIMVTHNNIKVRGKPAVRTVGTTVTREHVAERWSGHLKILQNMEEVKCIEQAKDVEADGKQKDQCDAYGGCPHRGRCNTADLGGDVPKASIISPEVPKTTSKEEEEAERVVLELLARKKAKVESVPITRPKKKAPPGAASEDYITPETAVELEALRKENAFNHPDPDRTPEKIINQIASLLQDLREELGGSE